jgi:hypothetical protein
MWGYPVLNFKLIQFLNIPPMSQATGSTFACALRMARKAQSIAPSWKLVIGEGHSWWKKHEMLLMAHGENFGLTS